MTRAITFTVDRQIRDYVCHQDAEGVHDIIIANPVGFDDHYRCRSCGHPARWVNHEEAWVVIRPFLVGEEP